MLVNPPAFAAFKHKASILAGANCRRALYDSQGPEDERSATLRPVTVCSLVLGDLHEAGWPADILAVALCRVCQGTRETLMVLRHAFRLVDQRAPAHLGPTLAASP